MKLFRRLIRHVLSIVTLLLLAGCATLAQDSKQQGNNSQNGASITDQDTKRDIRAIADQLKAIREDEANRNSADAAYEQSNWHYWFKGRGPIVWSNWFVAIVAAIAGGVAYKAFAHERDAVRLTQRADVLLQTIDYAPRTNPSTLSPNTRVHVQFKNFGPTRASNVRMNVSLEPAAELPRQPGPHDTEELPPIVLAAGESSGPRLGALGNFYSRNTIEEMTKGNVRLTVVAECTYDDVFGKNHHSRARAIYYGEGAGSWVVEQAHDAT